LIAPPRDVGGWFAITASDAEAVACDRKSFLGLRSKSVCDFCAISPSTGLVPACDAEGFSPQKIQLPSGGMNDQAIFLGHESDPRSYLDQSI
jgi:hypothetical protein